MGRHLASAVLLTLALAVSSRTASRGQPVVSEISNPYIRALVGVSGQTQNVTPAVNVAGRFGIWQTGATGLPLLNMADGVLNQSYVTVRIDGGPPTIGVDADTQTAKGWDLIFGDVGTNAADATTTDQKTTQGAWLQQPTAVGNNRLVAKWETLPGGNTTYPIPSIEVDLTLTLIHDMAVYEFTVINRDNLSHTVALRFGQDYNVPGAATDAPVFAPNIGNIYNEVDLTGTSVPPYWRATNPATGDTVGALLTDPTVPSNNLAARPYRVTFGNNGDAIEPLWAFTANPSQAIVDGSSGVYFYDAQYNPGQSRTIRTYFGKMHATIDFATPMAAGVDGPLTLQYDATKPAGQQLTPNPMTVTAFAQNLSQLTLTNVTATIALPTGLTLAAGETAQKTSTSLSPDSETTFSWKVVPTGTASGHLTYSVSFSAGPGTIGKSVVRAIDIPALPNQNFTSGWQMVSFPYTFDDPTPSVALGLDPLSFDILKWDQASLTYQVVDTLVPGQGYWLHLNSGQQITLQGTHPVTAPAGFEIKLTNGWNQIGNPFLMPVKWSDVRVVSTDPNDADRYTPVPVSTASDQLHRWILPTIYSYTGDANNPYTWSTDFSTDLTPFVGYWVKALKPGLSLIIPVPTSRAAGLVSPKTRAANGGPTSGWRVRLQAAATGQGAGVYLGASPDSTDAGSKWNVEAPPAMRGGISMGIVRTDTTGRSALMVQDIRGASGRKQWDVVINGQSANQAVTLTWPDLGNLPRGTDLYIVDQTTGQRTAMRGASSIVVHTGSAATTRVAVIAEPRSGAGVFRILSWRATPTRGGGATVSITTSQDATLTVRVLNSAGQSVRTLGSRASTGRSAMLMWDYRDSKGIAVPSGVYTIEVRGTTPDGQSATVPIPHVVVR